MAKGNNLTSSQLEEFQELGFLILPSFLPSELVESLKPEVDYWVNKGLRKESIAHVKSIKDSSPPPIMEIELKEHGWLISYPPLMSILSQLMGPVFAFHHLHSDRHDPGCLSKNWHHDYEQYPQANRSHIMIHALYYLSGLNGMIGDLAVLPGSHRIIANKDAFDRFGSMSLPGEVVINNLGSGSVVIIHSALFHTRRAQPGGNEARYFIDCSYCQGGVRWPVVKRYWKHMLAYARNLGLDRKQWPELFNESHFYDPYDSMDIFRKINYESLFEKHLLNQY